MPSLTTSGSPLLRCVPFAIAFVWLATALGRRGLRWLGATHGGSTAERGVVALGLGAGLLAFVPFTLGAASVLSAGALGISFLALALVLSLDVFAVGRRFVVAVKGFRRADTLTTVWLVALVPAVATACLLALTPTVDPDGLSYHLTAPKRWLAAGTLSYLPTYPYTSTPMGVEMLFLSALAFAGDTGAKVLHWILGCTGVVGLYAAGKRLRGTTTGMIAATRYLFGPVGVATLIGWAYVEGAASCAMIASSVAWIIWYRERCFGWLRAAALLAGIAVSFKMTAALFPLTLGALTLLVLWDEGRTAGTLNPRRLLSVLASVAPLVGAPVLPWLVRAAVLTHNPFFPMFARRIPSRDFSPKHAAEFDEYNRYMVWAGTMGRNWSLGERKAILFGVVLLICCVAGVAFVRTRSAVARGVVIIVSGATVAQILGVGLYARYWIPALAVLQLPVVAALEPFLANTAGRGALIAFTLIGSLSQTRAMLKDTDDDLGGLVRTAFGFESQRTFALEHVGLYPLYEYANRALPPNAHVLLSTTCAGFYVDRITYCAEFVQDALRYDSWEHFVEDARRLQITHVIAPRVLATGGPPPPVGVGNTSAIIRGQEYVVLGRLLRSRGRLLEQALDQGVYAVTFPDSPADSGDAPSQKTAQGIE